MKNTKGLLLVLILMLALVLIACDKATDNPSSSNSGNSGKETSTVVNNGNNSSCDHKWVDATCTAPQTCSICNQTEGNAKGHSWVDATCTAPKTCSVCGQTEGEVIDHNYQDSVCTMCQAEDPVSTQIKKGKIIYDKLNAINSISSQQASSVYDAWYFAIYEADDSDYILNVDRAIQVFASSVGLKKDVIIEAIDQYLDSIGQTNSDIARLAVLRTNSGAISTVLIAYDNTGINEVVDSDFAEVKALLKEMDSTYENETYYSTLKEYYSDSLAYYNFVISPSGSFNQLSTTLNSHTDKLTEHKNDLSFIYED